MGKLFRRVIAFVLGMVTGVTAVAGGIVGGAYWAYKNVKPVEMITGENVGSNLGDLESATMEELLDLLTQAVSDPDEYTFARLEKEYGFELKELLESLGLDMSNQNSVDLNALRDVSIFSLASGYEAFLDNVKLRALYVVLPKVTGKPIDEILSLEAREKLGDYTLLELMKEDELTSELGLVSALKNLKLGAILPSLYDATFDPVMHEYVYTVKEGSNLPILDLLGNIYVGTVFDVAQGGDIVEEIMEGGFKSISEKSLSEVLTIIGKTASPELEKFMSERGRAFGDTTVGDLFKKVEGKYEFTIDVLAQNAQIGYLLGYNLGKDGVWYKDADCTNKVEGIYESIASANLNDILENKDNMLDVILAVFGDVSIEDLAVTAGMGENASPILKSLYSIKVGDLLEGGKDQIVDNLRNCASQAFGEQSLGDILGKSSDNALENAIYSIKVGEIIKPGVSNDDILNSLQSSVGSVTLGAIMNYSKDENGKWICSDKMQAVLLDLTLNNAFDIIKANGNKTEMARALLGDYTLGDFFEVIFGFTYSEQEENWYREKTVSGVKHTEWIDKDFGEFLGVRAWEVVATLDSQSSYNVYNDLKPLTLGEILYSMLLAADRLPSGFVHVEADEFEYIESNEDGYAVKNNDVRQLSEIILQLTISEVVENKDDKQYWKNKLRPVEASSIFGILLSEEQENKTPFTVALLSVTVGDVLDLRADKSKEAISELVVEKFSTVEFEGKETVVYVADALDVVYPKWVDNCALEAVANIKFADAACALLGTKSKNEVFGSIKLYSLTKDYLGEKLSKSDLVIATLQMTVSEFYNCYKTQDLKYIIHEVLEPLYDGMTTENAIDDFWKGYQKSDIFVEFLSIELDDLLHAIHTKELDALVDKFKDCYNSLDKTEKAIVLVGAVEVVGVLYFMDNELLVKIADNVFGDDTWGEVLAERLGFEENDGVYTVQGIYNELANTFFNQQIAYTLDKSKCDIKEEYLKQITVGTLFASYTKAVDVVNGIYGVIPGVEKLSSDGNEIFFEGDYEILTRRILNIKIYEVWENKDNLKSFIGDQIGDLLLGDITASMTKKVLNKFGYEYDYAIVDGRYEISGSFINVGEEMFNLTLSYWYNNRADSKELKNIIGKFNMGDLLADTVDLFGEKIQKLELESRSTLSQDQTTWVATGNYDDILNILYNLNIRDMYNGMEEEGRQYFAKDETFGKIRLGHIIDKGWNNYDEQTGIWYNKDGEVYDFASRDDGVVRKRLYRITLGQLLDEDFNFTEIIEDVYLGEFMKYSCLFEEDPAHVHDDECVWYEEIEVYVVDEEALGLQLRKVKVEGINQSLAGIKIKQILTEGLKIDDVLEGQLVGDLIGLKNMGTRPTSDPDDDPLETEIIWHEFYKTVGGYYKVNENNEKITTGKEVNALTSTFASISAQTLTQEDAISQVMESIKKLRLGEVLEYTLDESDPDNVVWLDREGEVVTGAMQKLCSNTIADIENNFEDIIQEWTLRDILKESTISGNVLLQLLADETLDGLDEKVNQLYIAEVMGYTKNDDDKWEKDGVEETDEMLLVLADYQLGHITGEIKLYDEQLNEISFIDSLVNNIKKNVTVGRIFENAGKDASQGGNGFLSLLDEDWTLEQMMSDGQDGLLYRIKNETTVQQLIDLGAFGEFFDDDENYEKVDLIFMAVAPDYDGENGVTAEESRQHWTSISMSEFMSEILNFAVS